MKILFVYNVFQTFTKIDLDILKSVHEVRELHAKHHNVFELTKTTIGTIRGVFWAEVIFVWFGGHHALLPFIIGRLLGRRCIIVASGYDVANLPELNYGSMRPGIDRIIGLLSFHLSHKVLAVSNFTVGEIRRNVRISKNKIEMIYHGLDGPEASLLKCRSTADQNVVLTVSNITCKRVTLKGLSHFVEAASYLPDISFKIIGPCLDDSIDLLKKNASPNVVFMGPVYGKELIKHMVAAKVYVQISAYESFGMALAEAMLCECIPVVTDRGALPEVVGNEGLYVPYGDIYQTVSAIQTALAFDSSVGRKCRKHILNNFPLYKRRRALLKALDPRNPAKN